MPLKRNTNVAKPAETETQKTPDVDPAPPIGESTAQVMEDDTPPFEVNEQVLQETLVKTSVVETAQPVQPQEQAIATQSQSTIPATTATATTGMLAGLDDLGFEGLELGWGSFTSIKLDNGKFADSEENNLGTEIECILMSTKAKYILKNTKCMQDDEEVYYSYDREVATDGTPTEDIIAEWTAQGWGFEWKTYLDAFAQLVDETGEPTEMVVLSLPPTARPKISGYLSRIKLTKGLGNPQQYITRCKVGPDVKKEGKTWNPWVFQFVKQLRD